MNSRFDTMFPPQITRLGSECDHSLSKILGGKLIAGLMVLALSFVPLASATTFTVTDSGDGGANTLRWAVEAANSAAGPDTIDFNLASLPGTITLTSGELAITDDLTITGPGASSLAISGNSTSRVFSISGGVTANISGLTMTAGNGLASSQAGFGGAILNLGTLTLTNSTVAQNNTNFGGGISVSSTGSANLINTTLSGNSAAVSGGGIFVADGGVVTLTNSTVSGNSTAVSGSGGGFYVEGVLRLINATVSGNSAASGGGFFLGGWTASVEMKNTIMANSPAGGNCAGGGTSHGNNLSDDASCPFFASGDLNNPPGGSGLDPAGLQDNGGQTETIALLAGSLAIDAVPSPDYCTALDGTTPIATDQRGISRPFPAAGDCDMGAFEFQPEVNAPPVITSLNSTSAVASLGELASFSAQFTDADNGDTHTCTFSWGDSLSNSGAVTEPAPPAEGLCNGSHTYAAPGSYTIEVTVMDDNGASDSKTFQFDLASNPSDATWRMTGGGKVLTATFGLELHCNPEAGSNTLQVNWGKGNSFHLEELTSAACTGAGPSGFNTHQGSGTGRFNRSPGATATWSLVDNGEPGRNDMVTIQIKDAGGTVVLDASGSLSGGNLQTHE